jgi:serine/threonine protein kinase
MSDALQVISSSSLTILGVIGYGTNTVVYEGELSWGGKGAGEGKGAGGKKKKSSGLIRSTSSANGGLPVPVAVKVFSRDSEQYAWEAEAHITSAVGACPHIVSLFGKAMVSGGVALIFELAPFGSLQTVYAAANRRPTDNELAAIARGVSAALAMVHSSGMVHRDVKPANLLLHSSGRVLLADFGSAARTADALARNAALAGTPYFLAPEMIQDAGYNDRADCWALGVTLVTLLVGRPPHAGFRPTQVLYRISTRPAPLVPQDIPVSANGRSFVVACLHKDPEQRASSLALQATPLVASVDGVPDEALMDPLLTKVAWLADGEERAARADELAKREADFMPQPMDDDVSLGGDESGSESSSVGISLSASDAEIPDNASFPDWARVTSREAEGLPFSTVSIAVSSPPSGPAVATSRALRRIVTLARDPRLIPLVGVIETPTSWSFLAGPVHGDDVQLAAYLAAVAAPPVSFAMTLGQSLASAFAVLHRAGIAHGAASHHDVWLAGGDPRRARLAFAGTAPARRAAASVAAMRTWAPELLDPEVDFVTLRVDQYAFAIILWEVSTGLRAYVGLSVDELRATVLDLDARPSLQAAGLDPAVGREVCEPCWRADASARPDFTRVAATLGTIVENFSESSGSTASSSRGGADASSPSPVTTLVRRGGSSREPSPRLPPTPSPRRRRGARAKRVDVATEVRTVTALLLDKTDQTSLLRGCGRVASLAGLGDTAVTLIGNDSYIIGRLVHLSCDPDREGISYRVAGAASRALAAIAVTGSGADAICEAGGLASLLAVCCDGERDMDMRASAALALRAVLVFASSRTDAMQLDTASRLGETFIELVGDTAAPPRAVLMVGLALAGLLEDAQHVDALLRARDGALFLDLLGLSSSLADAEAEAAMRATVILILGQVVSSPDAMAALVEHGVVERTLVLLEPSEAVYSAAARFAAKLSRVSEGLPMLADAVPRLAALCTRKSGSSSLASPRDTSMLGWTSLTPLGALYDVDSSGVDARRYALAALSNMYAADPKLLDAHQVNIVPLLVDAVAQPRSADVLVVAVQGLSLLANDPTSFEQILAAELPVEPIVRCLYVGRRALRGPPQKRALELIAHLVTAEETRKQLLATGMVRRVSALAKRSSSSTVRLLATAVLCALSQSQDGRQAMDAVSGVEIVAATLCCYAVESVAAEPVSAEDQARVRASCPPGQLLWALANFARDPAFAMSVAKFAGEIVINYLLVAQLDTELLSALKCVLILARTDATANILLAAGASSVLSTLANPVQIPVVRVAAERALDALEHLQEKEKV